MASKSENNYSRYLLHVFGRAKYGLHQEVRFRYYSQKVTHHPNKSWTPPL